MKRPYEKSTLNKARRLREDMTPQERHLWYDFLRNHSVKFYKQRPIDKYIVDFYCAKAKLIIEIDGSQHYTEEGMAYDKIRTEVLEKYQLKVMRFTNYDIDRNFIAVCTMIDEYIKNKIGNDLFVSKAATSP